MRCCCIERQDHIEVQLIPENSIETALLVRYALNMLRKPASINLELPAGEIPHMEIVLATKGPRKRKNFITSIQED